MSPYSLHSQHSAVSVMMTDDETWESKFLDRHKRLLGAWSTRQVPICQTCSHLPLSPPDHPRAAPRLSELSWVPRLLGKAGASSSFLHFLFQILSQMPQHPRPGIAGPSCVKEHQAVSVLPQISTWEVPTYTFCEAAMALSPPLWHVAHIRHCQQDWLGFLRVLSSLLRHCWGEQELESLSPLSFQLVVPLLCILKLVPCDIRILPGIYISKLARSNAVAQQHNHLMCLF